jgi:hypothetical protein
MAVRSSISIGFPNPNFIAELGQRESILVGEYIIEAGTAVIVVTTGQIANLTLSATGQVIVTAAASLTIANATLSATGNIAVSAQLTATIDPITSDGTGLVIPSGGGDPAVPWWWAQYVARHQAEREARREAMAVVGNGHGVLPAPIGAGWLEHEPDAADDVGAIATTVALLLAASQRRGN